MSKRPIFISKSPHPWGESERKFALYQVPGERAKLMRIDRELAEALAKYILEKRTEDDPYTSKMGFGRYVSAETVWKEVMEHPMLFVPYITEHFKCDHFANELSKEIIDEHQYFQRKAFLAQIELLILKFRNTQISDANEINEED